ncbi:hypothetical protein Ae168Ps1_5938 [Pseudonocardia sp. Ae168_Ps1]|nr:hypothetical protein Ae168Ps1_5938 [Pseudonocardia sp. Ae168_Ps1]OLL77017.1 hypothetical protein Ae150APs1_5395c [Pseudonocardia sp. Ae150A_Ps1]OLL88871.1 hypothetical protein Ae263Ps1_5926 [Pseudonocardia sp. Ae263_Ps1]OLL91103.1 hypothetical protein Ae356Ps1_1000c [Pseudonocardia sp. Ae356_Ps1]
MPPARATPLSPPSPHPARSVPHAVPDGRAIAVRRLGRIRSVRGYP